MNPFLVFDLRRVCKKPVHFLAAAILVTMGFFAGAQFNLSVGEGVYLNSPYTIGFMTGLLSLAVIFIATIVSNRLLFAEFDSGADVIMFSFPVSEASFLRGRFLSFFLVTLTCFVMLMLGFMLGQHFRSGTDIRAGFYLWHYLFPLLLFGVVNVFFVCSFLFFLAFSTRKKLLVIIGGLLLYVLYMVVLLFSNSPFMSGSLPQSLQAQQVSAVVDPFGLSAYFFESSTFSATQRNTEIVPVRGYVLLNRVLFIAISVVLLLITFTRFSFTTASGRKGRNKKQELPQVPVIDNGPIATAETTYEIREEIRAVFSFARKDTVYLFKSISVVAVSLLLLFHCGMEMYAEIEKGIRIPQKYAGSGLMATTIIQNFHPIGMLLLVYFVNDIFWRSHISGFSLIENSTYFFTSKLKGHFVFFIFLLIYFSVLLVLEGLVFQGMYHYFHIDWKAYSGVLLFNTFPLVLFAGLLLWLNAIIRNRFAALGISILAAVLASGLVSQKLFPNPLLRIFSGFTGEYSDFNGFGIYAGSFAERLVFGSCMLLFLWMITHMVKYRSLRTRPLLVSVVLLLAGFFAGKQFLEGYQPDRKLQALEFAAGYEKQYQKFSGIPQPTITEVTTGIHLFPSRNAYEVEGTYTLQNLSGSGINMILLNFHRYLQIESAWLVTNGTVRKLDKTVSEILLDHPMKPGEKARLFFRVAYRWYPANGHEPFNAIIGNGSFLRISRYFPAIGYQTAYEIQDADQREKFGLGKQAPIKTPEAPAVYRKDFISLDMTVSTEAGQTAIGTGDLVKQWQMGGREYARYLADSIPFRFAVSSALYDKLSVAYKGIVINVLYHPGHTENVDHLVSNAKRTLEYCTAHFGKYPFRTINFAEVSSFTKGFAATAYPSAIFMTEDMIFHANIHADKKQDVINELAGHELAHIWWGNSGIDPDEREGAAMLTETLAMYTEMMLYKQMHGEEAMLERVKMHQQIYDSEKGFSENLPLYRVSSGSPHISYSKGAVVMVQLSKLLGEEKLNLALKHFLENNAYPKKPASTDFLNELYRVSPENKPEIDRLFKNK